MPVLLSELAELVGARLVGDGDEVIHQVATTENAKVGEITFISESRYLKQLENSSPSAVIVNEKDAEALQSELSLIVHANPYWAFAKISQRLNPQQSSFKGIHPSAFVDESVVMGEGVNVGPNVSIESGCLIGANVTIKAGTVIEHDVAIGDNVWIGPSVTICHGSILGKGSILQAGAVIGSEGFGFANHQGNWERIPQIGRVVLGADVNIGANTVIDRGAIEDTVIGEGVILDNLIQIAHNVKIGDRTAMAALSGVAGSTTIGANCMIAGASRITGHITICDGVYTAANTFISKSISEPGGYASGTPMDSMSNWRKNSVRFRQLDDLAKRVKKLEKKGQ